MTNLNLDGLPALQRTTHLAKEVRVGDSRLLMDEIRQLVERERIEQARGDLAEINRAAERLPAWAKPVMRAARRWEAEYGSEELTPAEHDLANALFRLTEAQRKEIGE